MKGDPLTILLVEDNPDHAELILRSLQDHRVANKVMNVTDGRPGLLLAQLEPAPVARLKATNKGAGCAGQAVARICSM